MDDPFDDFDEIDDGFDDDLGDGPDLTEEPAESDDEFWGMPDERDWAIIFPLPEEIAREKREKRCIRKDSDRRNDQF